MGAQAAWGRVIGEGSAMAHWRALVTCAYQRGGRTAGRRIASKVPRVGRDVLCDGVESPGPHDNRVGPPWSRDGGTGWPWLM